jgi:hypothetical protein
MEHSCIKEEIYQDLITKGLVPSQLACKKLYSLCMSTEGNALAVGFPAELHGVGMVVLYRKVKNVWRYDGRVLPLTSDSYQMFGNSLNFNNDGSVLAVGTIRTGNCKYNSNGVYVFNRSMSGDWDNGQKITTRFKLSGSFGYSVGLNTKGNRLVVGCPNQRKTRYDDVYTDAGSVYVYQLSATNEWCHVLKLHSTESELSGFGETVSFSSIDDSIIVTDRQGAQFEYSKTDKCWSEKPVSRF